MKSFVSYASEKCILDLLIKERVKLAITNKLKDIDSNKLDDSGNAELSLDKQVMMMMPPRDLWIRPSKKSRKKKGSDENKETKHILAKSIYKAIKRHRYEQEVCPDKYPYLKRLDTFIKNLKKDIEGDDTLVFESIKVIGKKKKYDSKSKKTILRPICIYTSLREKLLISLASRYLTKEFDILLHEEIISYRPLRIYHGKEELTNRDNAFESIAKYRLKYKYRHVYVSECDIQKYYDTINHDVIRECFKRFVERLKQEKGYADFDYKPVGRIVDAYLSSYSFYNNIVKENAYFEENGINKVFEEPKRDLLIERCYGSVENFECAKNKIGVPQGGALSTLISNVVLHTIDTQSILEKEDSNRFFCRYGDDIVLMHTSKKECKRLIDKYCEKLTEYKMIYHDFISVVNFRREDGTILKDFWNQKSRSPFLWGRNNEKEQVDWIGFLGYEMRYTGEVRIRRSTLDDKFKNIKRKYHSGANSNVAKGKLKTKAKIEEEIIKKIKKFKTDGLLTAKSLDNNRFTKTQALKLNAYTRKWLYRLLCKIAKNNETITKVDIEKYWNMAKELDCFNYVKTIYKK